MTKPIVAPHPSPEGTPFRARPIFVGLALLGLLLMGVSPSLAEDDLDDLMGGFDDEFDVAELDELEEEIPDWLEALPFGDILYERVELSGSIAVGGVWNYLSHTAADSHGGRTDYAGLSRLDLDGFLQLDVQLPGEWQIRAEALGWYDFAYRVQGRSNYNGAVLDVYEWQVDTGEIYVTGPLHENVDLTVGRKIVNWGRSDTFRVVDVVNPLDNKEPGLVDIEDLRRPKAMLKLDATAGPWSAQLLVIPEHRYDRLPPPGSDFIPAAFATSPIGGLVPLDERSDFSGMPGFAGKIDGRFSGWDFSVYAAYVDESSRVLDVDAGPIVQSETNRFGLLGAAGNMTRGAWLLKAEIAWLSNLHLLQIDPTIMLPAPPLRVRDRDRLDTMVGLEWYGPDQLTVALEIVNRHLLDHPGDPILQDFTAQDGFESAIRVSRPFFRERLDLTLLAIGLGERLQDGGIFRASGEFELSDSWKIEGGWLVFLGGPQITVGGFDSNDRVYTELKYSF